MDLSKTKPGEKFITREGKIVTFTRVSGGLVQWSRYDSPSASYLDGRQYSEAGKEDPRDIVRKLGNYPTNRK
jgi:hypothetical protein